MKLRLLMCGLLATALLIAGGCAVYEKATAEPIATPSAEVVSVRVAEQTDEGARLIITVQLTNPNPHTPLPLTVARYRVDAGGASESSTSNPARTLPADGTQRVELPISLAGVGALRGSNVNVSGQITYKPPGEVRTLLTESGVPLPTAGFSYSGAVQ